MQSPDLRRAKSEITRGETVGANAKGERRPKGPIAVSVSSLREFDGNRMLPYHTSSRYNSLYNRDITPHPTVSHLSNRTTNQKVAGSSPAERAPEIPRFAGKTWSSDKGPGLFPAL